MNFPPTLRKTIRILGVVLALVALVVFATGVVSDWNHHDSTNDARCPYCHWGHQSPIQSDAPVRVAVLHQVAFLPFVAEIAPPAGPVFSQTAPRAPPSA